MATFEYLAPRYPSGLLRLADVAKVAGVLCGGGLAVLPTETGYMIAALATDVDAIVRAFEVKGRNLSNTMHVACSSLEMAKGIGKINSVAKRLLGELTPGPITVVVKHTGGLPDRLVTVDGTVGIRVPDHPATLQVVAAVGAPVTATSLNRAGEPGGPIDRPSLEALGWPDVATVYIVQDDASISYPLPSTLVRVIGPELEILRAGPISEESIQDLLAA